jgi:hypothetical protein
MRSPLDDDSPSGRLLSTTPTSRATLTPPCSTVRPSTKDSGTPSRTEPNTIASGAPDACAPSESLRSPAPRRSSHQLPRVKVAAPTNVNSPTRATSVVSRASSTNSNATDPIKRPAPNAITTAMTFGLGLAPYATSAPTRSAEAPTAPQKNASITAGDSTVGAKALARSFSGNSPAHGHDSHSDEARIYPYARPGRRSRTAYAMMSASGKKGLRTPSMNLRTVGAIRLSGTPRK